MQNLTMEELSQKMCLTIEEAARYSSIGLTKLREICRDPHNKFTLSIGTKTLIKREEFEKFINGTTEI